MCKTSYHTIINIKLPVRGDRQDILYSISFLLLPDNWSADRYNIWHKQWRPEETGICDIISQASMQRILHYSINQHGYLFCGVESLLASLIPCPVWNAVECCLAYLTYVPPIRFHHPQDSTIGSHPEISGVQCQVVVPTPAQVLLSTWAG
jgi:hypothetical protein